ncbi:Protein SKG3 [Exophiala dermatitidis]
MGRLRNLSQSFKAAAFPSSSNNASNQSLSRASPNGQTQIVDKEASSPLPNSPVAPFADTPPPNPAPNRPASRPASMVYTSPSMDFGKENHIEELAPVFSFLSSHANKLYQEGYFLKLNDLDTHGRPYPDRNWVECFAQLVGTVLSLWDAAALDAAGQDGEVAPTFINLADASIKMIETLPTRNPDVQPLQNVLSVSTAGKNRYLLHFNSLHSLTQWTAGIRLAMFEHASLQELYTGSLIAGKGKYLNNIRTIMERTKFKTEDWARVRFGAGTPWRRCWCVIEPPDEKEWQKSNKSLKKKSAYEKPSLPKGDIKFYDTKKTKKTTPIATITDAYSAYAIYPQSKPLIDQSTLVKVEGRITIHSKPESKTEGFVFVMPELHPAVSGFEMMLRWLFPVFDVFHLYGRPQRLIADTWDTRGLMFAMPKERRYGYLDIIDVAALIHTPGSDKWSEREWRKQMKDMTSKRMAMTAQSRSSSTLEGQRRNRTLSESRQGVHYDDAASVRSTPSRHQYNQSTDAVFASPKKAATTPLNAGYLAPPQNQQHSRSVSESVAYVSPTKARQQRDNYNPSRLSSEYTDMEPIQPPPAPPAYRYQNKNVAATTELEASDSRYSSDSEGQSPHTHPEDIQEDVRGSTPPAPVAAPPHFQHQAGQVPQKRPEVRPDLRREKSRMSNATLSQMADVNKMVSGAGGAAGQAAMMAWNNGRPDDKEDQGLRGVNTETPHDEREMSANQHPPEAVAAVADGAYTDSPADLRPEYAQLPSNSEAVIARKPIHRKPVPASTTSLPLPIQHSQPPDDMSPYSASNYDNESSGTPDYDSLPEEAASDIRPRKTRTGVLKTVGDPSLRDYHQVSRSSLQVDIPEINFGTTVVPSLTPGQSRPPTASGIHGRQSPLDHPATAPTTPGGTPPSRPPLDERASLGRQTPSDERRLSYVDRISPQPNHARSRSYAWQPAAMTGRHSPSRVLTAEEFVQQRAAAARLPQGYVPRRSFSSGQVERSPSKLQKKRESIVRPSSRNSLLLDYSSHLSAREQEHVARMTGGPLIQVGERSRTPDPSVGLIGAIQAREQEKKNIKDGVAGHMVQEAIAQRQAAERTYGYQQYPGYQSVDPRQSGQWTTPPPSVYWGGAFPAAGPTPMSNVQGPQQHPQQQQQPNAGYNPAYGGPYRPPQGGYVTR